MIVRPCEDGDLASVADIYNESIAAADSTMDLTPKSRDDFVETVRSLGDRETLLVLEAEGRDVAGRHIEGWGILRRYSEREGYRFTAETSVYLRRRHVGKRTGYGSAIQAELMRLSAEFGYHHIVAKIWATNTISIRMHENFGFEIVGTQREIGYVAGNWQDVTILQYISRNRADRQ